MQVSIRGYLTLKDVLGKRAIILEDNPTPTLEDLLNRLEAELGRPLDHLTITTDKRKPNREFVILLNGQHLSHLPDGTGTRLSDGDVLSIFPHIAGG
jgi:MoaD family protein